MERLKTTGLAALLAAAPLLVGCSSDAPDSPESGVQTTPYRNIALDAGTRSAAGTNNDFAVSIFKDVSGDGNTVMSTYGVFSVLAMLANGDDAECRDEILRACGLESGPEAITDLNAFCSLLNSELPGLDGRVTFSFANSLWSEAKPLDNFLSTLSATFGAEYVRTSPAGTQGMERINEWAARNSEGMIDRFLSAPVPYNMAVLNSVYFNGRWQAPFDPEATANGVFSNLDGTKDTVRFMNSEAGTYSAYFDEDINAVELKYGSGNFSMLLIKPAPGKSFGEMKDGFTSGKYASMIASPLYADFEFELSLPRFSVRTDGTDMIPALKGLGLDKVFTQGLNSVCEGSLWTLSGFIQSVALDVDEAGTKAAAVSMGGMLVAPAPQHDPVAFDSPFIYIIRETSTNTILFMGQVTGF